MNPTPAARDTQGYALAQRGSHASPLTAADIDKQVRVRDPLHGAVNHVLARSPRRRNALGTRVGARAVRLGKCVRLGGHVHHEESESLDEAADLVEGVNADPQKVPHGSGKLESHGK